MTEQEFLRTEERLKNWGRWARSGCGNSVGTCASAERLYVAPRPDAEAAASKAAAPIDLRDAVTVDQAVGRLNPRRREFVTRVYVEHSPQEQLQQKFRLTPGLVVPTIRRLVSMLRDELESLDSESLEIRARRRTELAFAFFKSSGV